MDSAPVVRPIQKRFNKADRPCPVCGTHTKGCSVTDDDLYLCREGPSDRTHWREIGPADNQGFRHWRSADDPPPERNGRSHGGRDARTSRSRQAAAAQVETPTPRPDWSRLHREALNDVTRDDLERLAATLRLPAEAVGALDSLEVGAMDWKGHRVFTLPERNGRGELIGISIRTLDGRKWMVEGSTRGLSIPSDWHATTGPVVVVEGATDTLAGVACNLAMLGRPNDKCGSELLADFLRCLPVDREIVVVGENDRKPNGRWPGREGAQSVAKALAEELGRPVRIAFPPDGYKDSRERIADLVADAGDVLDLAAIGREFLGSLKYDVEPKSRFDFITAEEFDEGDYTPVMLINEVFTRYEMGLIAAPSKTLKTSIALDAAISIASGTPFLGKFRVPNKLRVAFVSGESGRPTLQETARRICRSKGFELKSLADTLNLSFACPTLSDPKVMTEFAEKLAKTRPDVVFLDPFYLTLGAIDPRNMFEVGACLLVAMQILGANGATVILIHHANRTLAPGQAMELTNLAYSGVEQFARQWLLLSRDTPYQDDGRHDITIRAGGSAGHGGRWAVRVEEGMRGPSFATRKWDVSVTTPDVAKVDHAAERERAKIEVARKRLQEEEKLFLDAIDAERATGQPAANAARIKIHTGFNGTKVRDVAERLIELARIEEVEFSRPVGSGASRTVTGYRKVET